MINVNRSIATTGMVLVLLGIGVNKAEAIAITGEPVGLTNPTNVINFDELGNLQNQVITNQFASYGVTFSNNFLWDNATFGQSGSIGFSGGAIRSPFPGTSRVISFLNPVTDAAFAAVDQNAALTVKAWLGGVNGTLVETFTRSIPFNPGSGFIGFKDILFDTIELNINSGISIDTLQFNPAPPNPVPEPITILGLGIGSVGMAVLKRKYGKKETQGKAPV
ncbi:PEP-CTERM sorting domain-containing protein [Anabaena sp. CCY 9402-a]|uniref:PEP-CTERM sorting domain-containing protein n=1 Tax=Anabaena sp. CCY 9402-a TaxID=3103867 RepID=UPI0039C6EAD8